MKKSCIPVYANAKARPLGFLHGDWDYGHETGMVVVLGEPELDEFVAPLTWDDTPAPPSREMETIPCLIQSLTISRMMRLSFPDKDVIRHKLANAGLTRDGIEMTSFQSADRDETVFRWPGLFPSRAQLEFLHHLPNFEWA